MRDFRFFVFGAPRSGTTWLQQILNAHPSINCAGEGHFIESIARPMQAALLTYRERMKTVARLVYDDHPSYPELTDQDINALIRSSIDSLLLRSPGAASSRWIGDKTPAYAVQLRGLNSLYPEAKLFHIVRDPRDTITSTLNFAIRSGVLEPSRDPAERARLMKAAMDRWRSTITSVASLEPHLQKRLLQLRYEDLKFDFSNTFHRLVSHLDLKTYPALTQKVERMTSFQAMTGGRAPGQKALGAFCYSGTVGQHVEDLRPVEIEQIEAELGALMADFGYEASQGVKRAHG